MQPTHRPLIALVLLSAVLSAVPASAFDREKTDSGVPLYWPTSSMPITYMLESTPPGGSGNHDAVVSQFQQWQSVACAKFSVAAPQPLGESATDKVAKIDSSSRIFWEQNWTYGSAVLGVTTPAYNPATGVIYEADMQFNNQDWTWQAPDTYDNCRQMQDGCADTASIALHEEGHFLGLAHSSNQSAVMYASWDGNPKRMLTNDDEQGICAVFPVPQPGTGVQDQACTSGTDCMSGLDCAATAANGTNQLCSQGCSGAGDTTCPSGDTCQLRSDSGYGCFPAPQGGTQGEACTTGNDCAAGFWCLGVNGDNHCYQDCNPSSPHCVGNLKCNAWSSSNVTGAPTTGTQGGYCDGMDTKPAGASECQTCDDSTPCLNGLDCIPLNDGSGASVCRNPCSNDTDCNMTNRCLPHDTFMSSSSVCACEVDYGQEGGPCRQDGTCNSGEVCVDDNSSSAEVCRQACGGSLPACPTGHYCKQIGRAHACVAGTAPDTTPDAGTPDQQGSGGDAPSSGCSSSAGALGLVSALGLFLRRRR